MITPGSVWRRWDLHVHSPYSFGGDFDPFCQRIATSPADIVGVNDYCSVAGYFETIKNIELARKPILPVIEFRMSNLLIDRKGSQKGLRINFHLIFDGSEGLRPRIANAVNSLPCLSPSGNNDVLGNIKDVVTQRRKVMVDYFNTIDHFSEQLGRERFLIWLPYDEYGGIDDIDPDCDAPFKVGMTRRADLVGSANSKQRDFFLWKLDRFTNEQYKSWLGKRIPCIKGSDAHSVDWPYGCLQDDKSQPSNRYCWIKADLTFEGLRQVTLEPEERVYLGEEPDVIRRVRSEGTRFISWARAQKISGSKLAEDWFDGSELPLNPQLVAVIGNKGSGKSALLDILGRLGGTRNMHYCSFLNDQKFRKDGKAGHFIASMEWASGDKAEERLSTDPEEHTLETVKYIPQQFLERLCNEEQDQFESELKAAVFSHIPDQDRLGTTSLDELVSQQADAVCRRISKAQSRLAELNKEIDTLEDMRAPEHRKRLVEELEASRSRLRAHTRTKPPEVAMPLETPEAQEQRSQILSNTRRARRQLKKLEEEMQTLRKESVSNKLGLKTIRDVKEEIKNLVLEYEEIKARNEAALRKMGVEFLDLASIATHLDLLEPIQRNLTARAREIKELLDVADQSSLACRIERMKRAISKMREKLRGAERQHEEYRQRQSDWEAKRSALLGDSATPGTHNFIRARLAYLDTKLRSEITEKRVQREVLVQRVLEAKGQLLDFYRQSYEPVTEFISRYKDTQDIYDVSFTVRLRVEGLCERLWENINHGVKGTFYGANEGRAAIESLCASYDFSQPSGLLGFMRSVIDSLEHDKRPGEDDKDRVISRQIKDGTVAPFYDYLFGLDYLVPAYEIRMRGKPLSELSPGERGALLLIFYLLIDQSEAPLIIDQPEENLDNQSVYEVLVKFIREAKQRRQVILATHNPNIAVGCDAEQVIYSSIDKMARYRVSYISGGIENPMVNQKIIDVLEGTMPAFRLRDSKYTVTKLAGSESGDAK